MNDTTSLALNIDRLMRRIHAELQPRAQDFDRHKVGPLGGMLLLTIGEMEPVDSKSVVEALGRDKSQISRLIQKLERKGLIEREPSPEDGRIQFLSLTSTGHDQLMRIKDVLNTIVDELFSDISKEDRSAFNAIIHQVVILDD